MNKNRTRILQISLLVVLIISLSVKFYSSQKKEFISHDESISLLSFQGTEGEFGERTTVKSIKAGEIQKLLESRKTDFSMISNDMATNDIHPPMYFYIMGKLQHLFQFDKNQLMYVNFLLQLITAAFLYLLAREFLTDEQSLWVLIIWLLSPAIFQNYYELRHYPLFEMFTTAYLWTTYRWIKSPKNITAIVGMSIFFLLSALTHYYTILVIGAMGLTLLITKRYGLFIKYTVMQIGLYLILLLTSRQYFDPILSKLTGGSGATDGPVLSIFQKTYLFVIYFIKFFNEHIIIIGLIFMALLFFIFKSRKTFFKTLMNYKLIVVPMLSLIVVTAGLYILGVSPEQAVGYEYFCYIWGLLTIVLVAVFHEHKFVLLGMTVLMGASSVYTSISKPSYIYSMSDTLEKKLSEAKYVEVTSLERGFIPRIAEYLNPACDIIVDENVQKDSWQIVIDGKKNGKIEEIEYVKFFFE